jgi:hypothetical protein
MQLRISFPEYTADSIIKKLRAFMQNPVRCCFVTTTLLVRVEQFMRLLMEVTQQSINLLSDLTTASDRLK